ncbi:MAG: ParB N-terminal domain-containing protein [Candidatus Saccharimonadales bacterium]
MQSNYELHPLCTLFPRLNDSEFSALVADIKANGLRQPITLHDGMILDGGNRYRACVDAGIEPDFVEFGSGNLVSFVLSANLHRRHMSIGQQAAIVASAQDWAQAHHQGGTGANQHNYEQSGNLAGLQTVADRAATSGAGERTQRMADKVAKASPELARQVAHGEKSLPEAIEEVTGKRPGAKPPIEKPEVPDELAQLREENEGLREANAEQGKIIKEMLEELESYGKVVDSGDQLTAAMAEAKKFREMNRILESRIVGLMNEKNEAVRLAKSWKRQADKNAS